MNNLHILRVGNGKVPATSAKRKRDDEFERAVESLRDFIQSGRGQQMKRDFSEFERQLHERIMGLEREILAEEMAQADIDAPALLVDGEKYSRVLRAEESYFTAAGEVRVMRTLYKDRSDESKRAICPMEYRLGIVEGRWTPQAAQQAAWVVAHLSPQVSEELFQRIGNMSPSKSTLDRLPKQLNERWESEREDFEQRLRLEEYVPEEAVTVAISLDGVMVPMKAAEGSQKRKQTAKEGKLTRGPAGYREVGCGALSFYDEQGEMLQAIRMGRMPQSGKTELKAMLKAELGTVLAQQPKLRVVGIADGAKDNWNYLREQILDVLPSSFEKVDILDFFHASEHLSKAYAAAYGEGTVKARSNFEKQRLILLEDPQGASKVIRSLIYLRDKYPRRKILQETVEYFRINQSRMRYREYREAGLPIGSGVIEASCKTLVTQRMKNSGMRWSQAGGQAILTLRAWTQSDRFDRAWALLSATYKVDFTILSPIKPLRIVA